MNESEEGRKHLGPGWEHLFVRDRRTEEEQKAAEAKDRATGKLHSMSPTVAAELLLSPGFDG